MSSYFLAVDGGGTKTDAVCADENGAVVGRGLSGPTNLTSTSVGAASFSLIETIRQAVESLPEQERNEFAVLVMGLAGIDSQKEHEEAYEAFSRALSHYKIGKFILVNDSIIALENGTDKKDALIAISGTGSICYGRNARGETAKASGMDFLLTDQGSGYAIGRRVLREAVKSYDHRAQKSLLEKLVCDHFKIISIADLKKEVYNPLLTKIEVADLAFLCSQAFEQNDAVAREIFDETVADIITMVDAVIARVLSTVQSFDCVFSGSVTSLPYIKEKLSEQVSSKYPQAQLVFPNSEPVYGALKMAIREK